ncbi:MAG: hypothetical protein HY674_02675 [Chloroflexi bacterium]|nr:hypothetical protein [Chloroflexota bacterium]
MSPEALTLKTMERLLVESFAQILTPERARLILDLRAGEMEQARVDDLAQKANQGELTPEEAAEYDGYIRFGTRIAILQAKARCYLQEGGLPE